ncbi:MAG: hypothetical protein M3Y91_16020, partial [Actinomycetota bacterium]|nr:hypothetical protein [Actinomycetota bacterium]
MSVVADAREATDEALARLVCSGALGNGSVRGDLIPDHQVEAAATLIESTDICARLAEWRAEDHTDKGRGGRPAHLDDRAVLVLFVLLALEHSPLLVTRMAETITHRLSDKAKALLGIDPAETGEKDWYDRAWRTIHSLLDVIDPFPAKGTRNRLLTRAEWADVLASRDPAESARKQEHLDWVCNELLEATLRMIPRNIRRNWKGNMCIDATPVAAFGKRGNPKPDKSDLMGIEPDADWYVREGDHRDPGDDRGKQYRKAIWGWEATLSVMSTNDPSGAAEFPYLVASIGLGKPGRDVSGHGARSFASIDDRHHPVGLAIADRAYFPNSKPENLQLPLRALGYKLVFDYKIDQLGIKDQHAGAIQVEGTWYCPAMPQPLIDATIDYRAKTIDHETWQQRIAQRPKYAIRAKERPDADGHTPMACPAAGVSATVTCPLKPSKGKTSGRTRIPVVPAHPDRICTNQSSVSFPPTAGAKYGQALPYGSPEWQAMYATARNTIEGYNGYIKDANREALDQPGRRRIRGYTAQYLFTTLLVVSANIRKLRTFLAGTAPDAHGTLRRLTRPARRRDRLPDYRPSTI